MSIVKNKTKYKKIVVSLKEKYLKIFGQSISMVKTVWKNFDIFSSFK